MNSEKIDYKVKVIIYGLPKMKRKSADVLCRWLRKQADVIEGNNLDEFGERHIARLMKTK